MSEPEADPCPELSGEWPEPPDEGGSWLSPQAAQWILDAQLAEALDDD